MRGKKDKPAGGTPKKPVAAPEKLARPFAEGLKAMKAELAEKEERDKRDAAAAKKAPKPAVAPTVRATPKRAVDPMGHYAYDDRAAFHQAFADVRPMAPTKTGRRSGQAGPISETERRERAVVAARAKDADDAARARLDALVAGSVRFVVEREPDGTVLGRRHDASPRVLDTVTGPRVAPTSHVDLHGRDATSASRELVRHIRDDGTRAACVLLVVHGKGLHSDGGVGVLADVVLKTLTESAIAPRVLAFATAAPRLGGLGATVVRLGPA